MNGRASLPGAIGSYLGPDCTIGVMVEIVCRTVFISTTQEFRALAHDIAQHIAFTAPEFIRRKDSLTERTEEGSPYLYEQPFIKDPRLTISGLLETSGNRLGEKIEILRFVRFEVGKPNITASEGDVSSGDDGPTVSGDKPHKPKSGSGAASKIHDDAI